MKITREMWQKASRLVAVGCLLLLVSCRALAEEAGRYQWTMAPSSGAEGSPIVPYMFDSVTGEIAQWDVARKKWIPSVKTSPIDWDDIRKQREALNKAEQVRIQAEFEQQQAEEKKQAEAQAKCDAFLETVPRKSLEELLAGLEELVEKAETIKVVAFRGTRSQPIATRQPDGTMRAERKEVEQYELIEVLKGKGKSRPSSARSNGWMTLGLEKKTGDLFVVFSRKLEEDVYVEFSLSSAAFDNKTVFPAPATIAENIKEIVAKEKEGN